MKPVQIDLTTISEVDWARLAAYIDGEGCISIKGVKGAQDWSRRVLYVDLTISNTDVRLVEWLLKFGGSVHMGKQRNPEKWAVPYSWNAASRHAALLLTQCLPYFIIKRDQAEIALAFQRTILTDRRYGRAGRPPELLVAQHQLREQLATLKGTSSRIKRTMGSDSIQ